MTIRKHFDRMVNQMYPTEIHLDKVLGTECTGSDKVALPRPKREQMITTQRGSAKLNENAKSAKPEPRDHHQSHYYQNLLGVFAVNSLGQKWPNQPPQNTPAHMNTNTSFPKTKIEVIPSSE